MYNNESQMKFGNAVIFFVLRPWIPVFSLSHSGAYWYCSWISNPLLNIPDAHCQCQDMIRFYFLV
jgi:hypothetical protein